MIRGSNKEIEMDHYLSAIRLKYDLDDSGELEYSEAKKLIKDMIR